MESHFRGNLFFSEVTLKHVRMKPIAAVCAALCHASVLAQEAELPQVIVIGTKSMLSEANRLGIGVQDTPQAVSVIDSDLIRAQNADTLEEVLRNVPGVTLSSGHSGIFSNYALRGFQLDNTSNYFKDGLRFDRQALMSLQNIKQVEVIRGPASMQYGKLVPGGLINFVTKKPQAKKKHEVTLYANQFGQLESAIDSTGKLNDSGSVLYRINAEAKKLDSFRNHVDGNAYLISPAFTFKPSNATAINISAEHNSLDTIYDPGQPAPVADAISSVTRLDPSAFYGESNADYKVRTTTGTIRITHRLNDAWQLRGDYSNSHYDRNMLFTLNSQVRDSALDRQANSGVSRLRSEMARIETFGNFTTGALNHNVLAGIDRLKRLSSDEVGSGASISSVDLFNPQPARNVVFDQTMAAVNKTKVRNTGVYLQDQMDLGKFSLMLGLRRDQLIEDLHFDVLTIPAGFSSATDTAQTSPSAGIVYRLLPTLSLYASYSRSLDANVAYDNCGRNFSPSRGTQYEAGLKGSAFGDSLQWSAVAFDLRRTNGLVDDPTGARDVFGFTCQVQAGEQRSEGIELEASGRIAKDLRLHGAYTHLNARLSENPFAPAQIGKKLKNAPQQSAYLWAEYALGGGWHGVSASLGMTYVGQRFADDANELAIPSHTVWDAGVRYTFSKTETLQLGVSNLTNRRYVESSAQSATSINQGAPRSVSVRYTQTF